MKTVRLQPASSGWPGHGLRLGYLLGAPLLVHLVLGPAFRDSVPVLRVFALWIPLIALATVMIFQLLLPNQLDNQFNFVNFSAGLLGILAALLLAPRFRAVGIAWSAVVAQVYTLVAFSVVLWRAGLNPFAHAAPPSARARRFRDLRRGRWEKPTKCMLDYCSLTRDRNVSLRNSHDESETVLSEYDHLQQLTLPPSDLSI